MAGCNSTTGSLYLSPPSPIDTDYLFVQVQAMVRHPLTCRWSVLILMCRYYVNTREQPPRSSWEHPGSIPPPPGPPPPDRSYSRSPYGDQPPQQGYGGYGYQPTYGQPPPQGYYNAPQGGYGGGPPPYASQNRGLFGLGSHHAGLFGSFSMCTNM